MGQVTLYVDDDTLVRIRTAAEASGLSMSAWLVQLVRERTSSEWPPDVVAMAGTWRDFPDADEIRRNQGGDLPRETF